MYADPYATNEPSTYILRIHRCIDVAFADMSGSGLDREENKPTEAGDFQGTKSLQKRQRNGLGRWRCNNSYAVQGGLSVSPPSLPEIPGGQGGIDETSRKA